MIDLDELIAEARRLEGDYSDSYEVMTLMSELADALEAAPRVPVQGEPNNDREALQVAVGRVVRDVMNFPQDVQARLLGQDMAPLRDALVDSVEAAGFSRAAVPDAATEELKDIAETHAFCADRLFIETELVDEIRAERDAALAAIERVRDAIELHNPNGRLVKEVLAALDGAPEPDGRWEYGFELIEPDDRNVFEREGDFISAAFAYRAAKKRIDEEHQADLPRLQYLIVRRRKAGPWLPVESEE